MSTRPTAIHALDAAPRATASNYPEPFRTLMNGRVKRALGDLFGLSRFGVNLVVLAPGAVSSLRHTHSLQDEFVFVLSGRLVLHSDAGRTDLEPGMCAGFEAGTGNAHRLCNEAEAEAVYLEVGDRSPGDEATYPDDDLVARLASGAWVFSHKDGRPYADEARESSGDRAREP